MNEVLQLNSKGGLNDSQNKHSNHQRASVVVCARGSFYLLVSCPYLCPDLQQRVPGAGAQRLSVLADAEARHAVLVRALVVDLLPGERVPDVAVVVVVAGEEVLAREREGH